MIENDFHRGNGGYHSFNRYWTTITYDNSIKKVLNVTPELIKEVRVEMAAERALKAVKKPEPAEIVELVLEEALDPGIDKLKIVGKAGVVYGLYKASLYMKKWGRNRKESRKQKAE